jgi:mannose/fructose/N-acetylgalactosamine-specific phosphotransferase system component IIC
MHPLLVASLLGGALSFEYRTSIRLYLSAPLVSGLITGLLLGYALHGLMVGVLMQLLFIGSVRLRGRPEADLPPAGVIAAAAFILVSRDTGRLTTMDGLILFWSLLLGLAAAVLGSIFYTQWEKFVAGPAGRGLELARKGRTRTASAIHIGLSLVHFAWGFLVVLAVLLPGLVAVRYLSTRIDVMSAGSMGSLPFLIPLIAAGAILKLLRDRTRLFWFGAGFLIAAVFFIFGGGV